MRIFLPILLLAALAACQKTETPESVVRQWQAHIDNNEFEQAKALSSPQTAELISWMQALLTDMDAAEYITQTTFTELKCRENGDQAVCYYTIEEEGEIFQDSFILVRINGKWLVDLPDEEDFDEEEGDWDELYEQFLEDSLIQ